MTTVTDGTLYNNAHFINEGMEKYQKKLRLLGK